MSTEHVVTLITMLNRNFSRQTKPILRTCFTGGSAAAAAAAAGSAAAAAVSAGGSVGGHIAPESTCPCCFALILQPRHELSVSVAGNHASGFLEDLFTLGTTIVHLATVSNGS